MLLRYVLSYNLKVSFNFHLLFLQLNVIKMFTTQEKRFFSLLPAIFFELPMTWTPDNSNFFRFPLKVRVIGSPLYLYTVKNVMSFFRKVRSKAELRIRFQPASLAPGGTPA